MSDRSTRPLISVIIPSYNRSNTVGETIESIVNQNGIRTNFNVEIIIGDDCSTDNAREVLEHYKHKYSDIINLFFREKNIGLGANWAQCVKDSCGDYICNCDNDDYWHNPNKLLLQLDYMGQNPECNVLITDHRTHNRATGEINEVKAFIRRDIPLQNAMWGYCSFCNATIMYRTDFLKSHINLDDFIEKKLSLQDWPTWVILSAYTDFDILPVSTATFGIETTSITRPESVEKLKLRLEKDHSTYMYLCELFPFKFTYSKEEWEQYVCTKLFNKAFQLFDYKSAHQYSKQSIGIGGLKRIAASNKLCFFGYNKAKKLINLVTRNR